MEMNGDGAALAKKLALMQYSRTWPVLPTVIPGGTPGRRRLDWEDEMRLETVASCGGKDCEMIIKTLSEQLAQAKQEVLDHSAAHRADLERLGIARIDLAEARKKLFECEGCAKNLPTIGMERDQMRKALERYGKHSSDCSIGLLYGGMCSCGFDAALKGGVDGNQTAPNV